MTDRELLDQILLKLLDIEARIVAIERQSACKHEPVLAQWTRMGESPKYSCRLCGAKLT